MKYLLIGLAAVVLNACNSSGDKKASTDTSSTTLRQRLTEFLQYNDEMKLDKVMDYTYPKVFKLVPREQLLKTMQEGFNADDRKIDLDSMRVEKLHPVFQIDGGSYARVDYSMVMVMTFKNPPPSTHKDSVSQIGMMKAMFEDKYGKENISIDKEMKVLSIRTKSTMVAVKDNLSKDWSFVNLTKDNPFVEKVFTRQVLDSLDTFK